MDEQVLKLLEQINNKLENQGETLKEHGLILKDHGLILKDHGLILGALKVGQEGLKAELNELRLQNAKEFGELKEKIGGIEVSVELLREDNWSNQQDIRRVQKTIGIK